MPKLISPSGQVYSPFQEYFYSVLLTLLGGQVLLRIVLSGIHYLMPVPPDGNFLLYLTTIFNLLSVLMVIGTLIHFIRIKYWLVVATMIALFFAGALRAELFSAATYFTLDFGPVILMDKIIFWLNIAFAAAFIYSDRNRLSWLLFYGLCLASSEILRLLFWDSPGLFLNMLNSILLVSSDLIIWIYLWHYCEKKMPFWFLMPRRK